MRDDFSTETIRKLGERVGLLCSNPGCRAHTKGAHTSSEKAANVGKGCHIHAASEGGPRYEASQTQEQRRSIENGIWLCSNCGTLIDSDEKRFPASLLRTWKADAEAESTARIGKPVVTGTSGLVMRLSAIPLDAVVRLSYIPHARRPDGMPHSVNIVWGGLDSAANVLRFTCAMGNHGVRSYAAPISDVEEVWCPDDTWHVRVSGYLDHVPLEPYRYVSVRVHAAGSRTPKDDYKTTEDAREEVEPTGGTGDVDPYAALDPRNPNFIDPYGGVVGRRR